MYMFPALSRAIPEGNARLAAVAGPPSPAKPDAPVPAIELMLNFGPCPKLTPARNTLAKTDRIRDTVIS